MHIPSPAEIRIQKVDAVVSQLQEAVRQNQHVIDVTADYSLISDALKKFNSSSAHASVANHIGIDTYRMKLHFQETAESFEKRVDDILSRCLPGLKAGRRYFDVYSELFAVDQACRRLQAAGWRVSYTMLRALRNQEQWSIHVVAA